MITLSEYENEKVACNLHAIFNLHTSCDRNHDHDQVIAITKARSRRYRNDITEMYGVIMKIIVITKTFRDHKKSI